MRAQWHQTAGAFLAEPLGAFELLTAPAHAALPLRLGLRADLLASMMGAGATVWAVVQEAGEGRPAAPLTSLLMYNEDATACAVDHFARTGFVCHVVECAVGTAGAVAAASGEVAAN